MLSMEERTEPNNSSGPWSVHGPEFWSLLFGILLGPVRGPKFRSEPISAGPWSGKLFSASNHVILWKYNLKKSGPRTIHECLKPKMGSMDDLFRFLAIMTHILWVILIRNNNDLYFEKVFISYCESMSLLLSSIWLTSATDPRQFLAHFALIVLIYLYLRPLPSLNRSR